MIRLGDGPNKVSLSFNGFACCRMNPAATVEAQREDKLTHLQQECNRLQERVRVLEGGQMQDVTQEVNLRLAASSTQEVQGNIYLFMEEQY